MIVRNIVIAVIVAFTVFFATKSQANPVEMTITDREIQLCTGEAVWKTIGTGAAYGGAIMLVGTGLGVAFAPAGTIVAPAALIASNTVTGTLVGAGSAAAGLIYLEHKFGMSPLQTACVKKAASDKVANAKAEAARIGNSAINKLKSLF